ncbi:MAG: hypothetical protein JKY43_01405 [Phycisphaerales bacterium]|nr:hypothetical protein [Phycisphaerales bacterium]
MIQSTSPLMFVLLALSCTLGVAQPERPAPTFTPSTTLTELEIDPISLDSIGLTINLPKDAQAETVRIGNSTSTGISLPQNLGTIIIKEQRTSDEKLTALKASNSIRDQLMNRPGAMLLDEQHDLRVGIWKGHRFYVRTQSRTGSWVYRGVTIFGHKPKTFLIFDFTLEGTESQFNQARVLYETSIATMNLQEMSSQTLKRAAGFSSTTALLDQLSFDDYAAVLTGKKNERWERLYTPAKSGDEMDATEHGYRRIKSWSGYKGELSSKDKSKWTTEDRKLGYLLQIDSMAMDAGLRIDSRALFYMSLDENEETWTIRMTLKSDDSSGSTQNDYTQDSAITGARKGGKLTITTVEGNNTPTTISPFIPENGYITQVQSYLIGSLIVHKQLQGDFASYSFNPVTNSVALRWDISEQPASSPGLWTVTSKNAPDSPPTETLFNAHGDLMRVRLNNGRLWEPIELERLLSLWKRKGLPI